VVSLLTRYLTDAHRAALSKRVTPNGFRLDDVIRSGLRHPDSSIGVYAPDFQSYDVFRELFDPILENFQAPSLSTRSDLACVNPEAVVSTRIRMARNLTGHTFPAGMSASQRVTVEAKIAQACSCLAPEFEGMVTQLRDMTAQQLDTMIASRLAFGPQDKYMAAAGIHADWPTGRSVFNTHDRQLSVWINEEDHLRVAVVMPGACVSACHQVMLSVMSMLAAHLDFAVDTKLGYLTSCPSNAGIAMRVSCRVDGHLNASHRLSLDQIESAGILQIRAAAGEHAQRSGALVDISFRNRVGISEQHMLRDMDRIFVRV
jgi:protein-arginine kinase